jgi:hypothetical protein
MGAVTRFSTTRWNGEEYAHGGWWMELLDTGSGNTRSVVNLEDCENGISV